MVQRKPECTEVIAMEEPIRQLEKYDQMIFVITQGHRMKVITNKAIHMWREGTCNALGKLFIRLP
jgi:hypothetical protein